MKRNHTGHRVGQDHQKAKLTDEQVREIRAKYRPHEYSMPRLAKEYGAGLSTIRDIVTMATRWSA